MLPNKVVTQEEIKTAANIRELLDKIQTNNDQAQVRLRMIASFDERFMNSIDDDNNRQDC